MGTLKKFQNNVRKCTWLNKYFPNFFLLFYTFLWRCGNAVPTRSGGMGTPFPRVPIGNEAWRYQKITCIIPYGKHALILV